MTLRKGNPAETESVLRYLRLAAGLSREELAREVQLAPQDIERFENGSRWLPIDQVCKLSDYFCVSCSALLWNRMEEAAAMFRTPIARVDDSEREHHCSGQAYRQWLGAAGEEWVADQEREKLAGTPYENAVNPNYACEESAHFDVMSFTPEGECVYIEVKTTEGEEDHPFFLTASELRFIEQCLYEGKRYELHRVLYAADPELCWQAVYTAQEVLEQFDRIPSAYLLCRKEAA